MEGAIDTGNLKNNSMHLNNSYHRILSFFPIKEFSVIFIANYTTACISALSKYITADEVNSKDCK